MKTIYLANPYGFSKQQKRLLLPEITAQLTSMNLKVWEPFERNNQVDLSKPGWAYKIGGADKTDVINADAIFAICNMNPPDEGVMVELGIAIALQKPTFLFRDDFRSCCDSNEYPLNLMLFTGMPQHGWEEFYYTSVEDICNQSKGLYKWAVGGI